MVKNEIIFLFQTLMLYKFQFKMDHLILTSFREKGVIYQFFQPSTN